MQEIKIVFTNVEMLRMSTKPANTAQKKWMNDITDWAEHYIDKLYGHDYMSCIIQRHHVLGRSAKQNKVAVGHYFILPIPFMLHDVSSNHPDNVTHHKKAFVRQFGDQRHIFGVMYRDMKEQGYNVPDISIYDAIMSTRA